MKRITDRAFKDLFKEAGSAASTEDLLILKYHPGSIEKADTVEGEPTGNRKIFRFRMTDANEDREGDKVYTSGGLFDSFEKGGSLLWGHRSDDPWLVIGKPIGRIDRRAEEAYGTFELMDGADNPVAGLIGKQLEKGFVRGSSIGFRVIEAAHASRDGYMPIDFVRWELLEHSVTPVPANPRALVDAKHLNDFETSLLRTQFERALDGEVEMPGADRSEIEICWRSITPATITIEVADMEVQLPATPTAAKRSQSAAILAAFNSALKKALP